jgi:AcrR family transcriptional regulator
MKRKQAAQPPKSAMPEEGLEKSEQRRRRILDATLACYVEYGWSGTNMSVISRHVGMTRGMIQYYFPTLEDVLHASIPHLNSEWRKKYFDFVQQESGTNDRLENRLDVGINALWRLMQDPLHIARQELVAAARSNAELRAVLKKEAGFDEMSTLATAKQTYPDLARTDETTFRHALDYTVVFLEGLSRHQFSVDAAKRCRVLLDMLKEHLSAYWHAHGIEVSPTRATTKTRAATASERPAAAEPTGLAERERDHVLALILKAASILSTRPDHPDLS